MQQTEDITLLRQYVENQSDEAFAELVQRHVNLVYSVALRSVGNPHNAEEITQAVFIILAKKATQLNHHKALSSWLFQTTRLTANNFLRSENRRQHREQEAFMQGISNQPETEVWSRIAPLVDDAVGHLREEDRRAILLRFYQGRTLREVGEALGTTEGAAEKRVNRALEKLRGVFSRHGVSSTTMILAGIISTNTVQAAPIGLAKTISAVAVARGATASASTLTLIKGALKVMAWTKVKTAAIIGAAVIFAAGTTTGLVIKHSSQANNPISEVGFNKSANQSLQGRWKGTNTAHPGQTCTVNISGDQIEYHGANPNDWLRGTFAWNENANPKQLNVTISAPAKSFILCVYEVSGDRITIAAAQHGLLQRPIGFSASEQVDVLELQRN